MKQKSRVLLVSIVCAALLSGGCAKNSTEGQTTNGETDGVNTVESKADGETKGMRGNDKGGTQQESHYLEAADKFSQYEYTDEETGCTIPYNLFLPESYGDSTDKQYPLVIYIADAGVNSDNVKDVLTQDGALVWATDEEQAKHECIVLAPQYTNELIQSIGMLTEDTYEWSEGLTLVSNLIFHIIDEYRVDEAHIYGTGQSQGGMSTIAISDKYPDLYAAQFLVACQWDVEEMSVMKDDNLWIVVCEGDTKAYPGMNAAVENWRALGASAATSDMWDSTASADEIAALAADMESRGCAINYTVFEGGSHSYTWTVAYTIEEIRDWIFKH